MPPRYRAEAERTAAGSARRASCAIGKACVSVFTAQASRYRRTGPAPNDVAADRHLTDAPDAAPREAHGAHMQRLGRDAQPLVHPRWNDHLAWGALPTTLDLRSQPWL